MSLFSFSAGQINGQTLFSRLEWQMSVTTSEIAVDEQGKNKISSQRWPSIFVAVLWPCQAVAIIWILVIHRQMYCVDNSEGNGKLGEVKLS